MLDDEELSTRQAESRTSIAHSEFVRIRRVNLARFTIDRLVTILGKLGQEVEVSVSVHPRTRREATRAGRPPVTRFSPLFDRAKGVGLMVGAPFVPTTPRVAQKAVRSRLRSKNATDQKSSGWPRCGASSRSFIWPCPEIMLSRFTQLEQNRRRAPH